MTPSPCDERGVVNIVSALLASLLEPDQAGSTGWFTLFGYAKKAPIKEFSGRPIKVDSRSLVQKR
jgi:hypothetical protein